MYSLACQVEERVKVGVDYPKAGATSIILECVPEGVHLCKCGAFDITRVSITHAK